MPAEVRLKDPKDFKLIGKHAPRKDSADKTDGTARFTQDVHLPGMLTAVVAHPPRFGAQVRSFDATNATAVTGVVDVVQIPTGVAVLAHDTWSAKKGRDALQVEWDESAAFMLGTEQIFAHYHELAKSPGAVAREDGDPHAAFAQAVRVLRADYDFPYLAHAAMEPMNCVVRLGPDGCEIWNGEQLHTVDQMKLAALLGLAPEQVTIHMLYAGGSWAVRRFGAPLAAVVAVAVVIQLAPLAAPQLYSTDVYGYWDWGRIAAIHDANPYADLPSRWPDDPAYGRPIVVLEPAPQGVGHEFFRYRSWKLLWL